MNLQTFQEKEEEDALETLEDIADYAVDNRAVSARDEFMAYLRARDSRLLSEVRKQIGFLRQWLNEDRITEPKKMVTNQQIELWLTILSPEPNETKV